jgi:hypothetical protein
LFKVARPLDFSLTGILASMAEPLAKAEISIFPISTFDTDYPMVKEDKLESAVRTLTLRMRGLQQAAPPIIGAGGFMGGTPKLVVLSYKAFHCTR